MLSRVVGKHCESGDIVVRLYESRGALAERDLVARARELGLDADRVAAELASGGHASRVQRDVESGLACGVAGTPAFFVNGHPHDGSFDAPTLVASLTG